MAFFRGGDYRKDLTRLTNERTKDWLPTTVRSKSGSTSGCAIVVLAGIERLPRLLLSSATQKVAKRDQYHAKTGELVER